MIKNIEIGLIDYNKGQVEGLPKNPRFIRDSRYEAMRKSIEESPEMLELRELIVFPYQGRYVTVCGNQRLRASKELKFTELPCKVLAEDTPAKKLREYASKDNFLFGEDDKDILDNEWNKDELVDWGMEFEPEKPKDKFKQRFESIHDEDAIYPLVPKYDEKHELFIIMVENAVDANWLREQLNMQKMKSYKTGAVSKSNVVSFKDFQNAIKNSNTKP